MHAARPAIASDLTSLLELFRASEVSAAAEPFERAAQIWTAMLAHPGVDVFVADRERQIVATCMLITAPNLLRGGRGHGFLENVVAHPDFRGRGYGRAVVAAALQVAWAKDCHHVAAEWAQGCTRPPLLYELRFCRGIARRLRRAAPHRMSWPRPRYSPTQFCTKSLRCGPTTFWSIACRRQSRRACSTQSCI